ncbi:Restriction endonuclease- type II-like superfamily protein [Striga hermonthica]|uniref:Restriction endonuclease- type II-like superfamily protein n=1 Tax=Striga hermonthica TaxID=68872 RepID=A0A9N7RF85_STRHE|nr:Restriction endonuclease- type II-like superfamily protein [Striga hermonthica]
MTNARVAKLGAVHKRTMPLPVTKNFQVVVVRYFSTCAAPLFRSSSSSSTPLIHLSPSFVLNSCLTSSDAPQRSDEWFALRKDKLTTSTFSTALGLWKGNRRYELWHEKVFPPSDSDSGVAPTKRGAMEWGVLKEAVAIERYKSITGRDVGSLGFAVHSDEGLNWIGASPDGLLGCFPGGGILEVKCPYNKGRPEMMLPWSNVPFYYMPQVQGQMEVMDRDWADLYCWTPNGSSIFRVCRDRGYWELMCGVLREFWWENVLPARTAVLAGRGEEEVKSSFKPSSTHKLTGLIISRSLKMARETRLLSSGRAPTRSPPSLAPSLESDGCKPLSSSDIHR